MKPSSVNTMLILVYLCCIKIAYTAGLVPKFYVWTPNKLTIDIALEYELFACLLRTPLKNQTKFSDVKCEATKHEAIINDEELDIRAGSVLKYSFLYRNLEDFYLQTGTFTFGGVYSKPPLKLQNRLRREVSTVKDSSSSDLTTESINTEETQTEIFNVRESRFGNWHSDFKSHKNFELEAEDFDPQPGYGPSRGPYPRFRPLQGNGHGFPQGNGPPPYFGRGPPPPWGSFIPPNGGRPDFGVDCNDHRHDSCHNRPDTEKLKKTTFKSDNQKCCPCGQNNPTTGTTMPNVRYQN